MDLKKLIRRYREDMHELGKGVVDDYDLTIEQASNLVSDDAIVSFDAGYYRALSQVCKDLHKILTQDEEE